ncbi:hypothetical protein, partial [Clostridium sp. CF012]
MKKIADLNSEQFYGIDILFEYSRVQFYKTPFFVLSMGFMPLLLKIPYGRIYINNHGNNLALKIFFVFMLVYGVIQSVLSICLLINMKLKKRPKKLFSISYFVFVTSIILMTWLISLSSIVYAGNKYYLVIIILVYISYIIFLIISVCRERKRIIEAYYSKEKNITIDPFKFMHHFLIAMIPVAPFYILSVFKRTKFI